MNQPLPTDEEILAACEALSQGRTWAIQDEFLITGTVGGEFSVTEIGKPKPVDVILSGVPALVIRVRELEERLGFLNEIAMGRGEE